jgi:acetylornithine deacetylase
VSDLLDSTVGHLRALVAFDTRNPPRAIGTDGIFDYLRTNLRGFACETLDHGAGAVSLHAVRGKPKILFNVHLDTVPDSPHWSASPFALRVDGERAVGLGACDIKGAAAAMLTAAAASDGDAAFLFTSDEEANDARCIAAFLEKSPSAASRNSSPLPAGEAARRAGEGAAEVASPTLAEQSSRGHGSYETVIVAEPTRCEAVLAHRGISSVLMRFNGRAGHASNADASSASAVHQAIRWGTRAMAHVDAQAHARFGGLTGLRFNIGRIEGGIKANVIAPATELRFGFRPLPSMDTDVLLDEFRAFADPAPAEFTETFRGPSLPAGNVADAESRRLAARDAADALGIPIGNAVDFWTEASLFSQAGYTTLVFGPGDIAQAHTADEWIALAELDRYTQHLSRLIADRHA